MVTQHTNIDIIHSKKRFPMPSYFKNVYPSESILFPTSLPKLFYTTTN